MSDSLRLHGLQHTRLPVHHQLPELTQTHVRWVSDAIQPSHSLLSPSLPACNLSQHQGLFKWVSSSHHKGKREKIKYTLPHSISPENTAEHKGHLATCFGFFGILVCSIDKGEWINSLPNIKISECLNRMHTWLDILRTSVEHCCLVIKPHKNLARLNLSLGSKYQIINLSLRPSRGFKSIIGPLVQRHSVIKIHKLLG